MTPTRVLALAEHRPSHFSQGRRPATLEELPQDHAPKERISLGLSEVLVDQPAAAQRHVRDMKVIGS